MEDFWIYFEFCFDGVHRHWFWSHRSLDIRDVQVEVVL